jgi:hypothetical protein
MYGIVAPTFKLIGGSPWKLNGGIMVVCIEPKRKLFSKNRKRYNNRLYHRSHTLLCHLEEALRYCLL